MQRRSSGSSQDSADASVKASRIRDNATSKKVSSTTLRPHDSPPPTSARNRIPNGQLNWQQSQSQNGASENESGASPRAAKTSGDINTDHDKPPSLKLKSRQFQPKSPWAISIWTFFTSIVGIALLISIVYSSANLQCDPKGCRMSWMSPSFIHFSDFDTEHTRFASKYSLHLYREQGIENRPKVRGIPVLFIPGNAGSYKQVRSIASESARYFHETLQPNLAASNSGVKGLDFFTVDFNEDFTAFHGQTMLDQAEYVNEAIRYILSLYLDPQKSERDPNLPDPSSVIILGHSMGGIVARTAFVMPNFQAHSINSIVTMSAPHARPPVTFDPLIVKIYQDINDHWRHAYSTKSVMENSLADVTLVSIAGGGLDTVVPSDYASLESIVPETHGFTVFTSTIPTVWTSMDHLAITWCDQFRKVIVRALYDIVDSRDKSQTKPRADRMKHLKSRFLTGLEPSAGTAWGEAYPTILLTVGDDSSNIDTRERFVLRNLGTNRGSKVHLLPVQSSELPRGGRFTLLSNRELDYPGEDAKLEVLLCGVYPSQTGQASMPFLTDIDMSGDSSTSTRLACKSAAQDAIALPASTRDTKTPFFLEGEQQIPPFSYLQYEADRLRDYQFIAIVDRSEALTSDWIIAEFGDASDSHLTQSISIRELVISGLQFELSPDRPMVVDIRIPSIQSSLLAYHMELKEEVNGEPKELFRPLVRQYLARPYESKYFVDAKEIDVSLHGVSPFVPPPLDASQNDNGLGIQLWTDPTRQSSISIRLTIDPIGSLGKLYMRYRTVFASFPQLVVGLVLRKQFRIYDNTGTFIPFSESLGSCLQRSLPMLLLSMTFLSLSIGQSGSMDHRAIWSWWSNTSSTDLVQNGLLVGTTDPFFWFLIPMIGVVCVGVCVVFHYIALVLLEFLSIIYGWVFSPKVPNDDKKNASASKLVLAPVFTPYSPRRRLLTTSIMVFLVSTIIPYQSAYAVACLVQLFTNVRAHYVARVNPSVAHINFRNYVHTIFLLMLWNLPINLPTVVVWVRNLAINWFTPFSSQHNVLSILPFILLVENLTAGRMIPAVTSRLRHLTNVLFFATAVYAAVYGVSYAYVLHYLVNLIAAWLVAIHATADSWAIAGIKSLLVEDSPSTSDCKQSKKR
ncbi:PGAP1-like protein-domain-containing protein [Xylaria bambusicola]|uniref:PGAP1-like protein-domain-containing protein n=1 Tax=Xylaria bambusicola TaxID=326684 RepID=UPI002007A1DF|nr:PGAP1-like protein-domain-containing protein [Xylaria bambusicola]KAI0506215.1 PGAP1-like protein-domain-containing protein [Xylaria bambusicola]